MKEGRQQHLFTAFPFFGFAPRMKREEKWEVNLPNVLRNVKHCCEEDFVTESSKLNERCYELISQS